MYTTRNRLLILDVDGTLVDAFAAIDECFRAHGMALGELDRFQKRHKIFKYLGGVKEFPGNLAKQIGKKRRERLLDTLTDNYRQRAQLYPGLAGLLRELLAAPGLQVGIVTRNVCREPLSTLRQLFARHEIDMARFDFVEHLNLREEKAPLFRRIVAERGVNPARAYACGDEHRDYAAAIGAGMHPFISAYGFESRERLEGKFAVPPTVIADTPAELAQRLRHALDLVPGAPA